MQFVITIAFLAFSGLTLALPTQERTDTGLAGQGEELEASKAITALVDAIGGIVTTDLETFATKVATGETDIAAGVTAIEEAITTLTT
jgi:hypothetical protein